MPSLLTCGGCARHVRAHEPACPFCGFPVAPRRRWRAGPWLAGAVLAGLATTGYACACYGGTPNFDSAVPGSDAARLDSGATDAAPGTDAAPATDAAPGTDASDAGTSPDGGDAGDGG